ncbi:ferredoxin-NADP reductase/uncharacterized protein YcbX [Kibdelosporangium banguiense]|uniref:Ferredoxin-NADP reductase/uncharacterized protein YcbX n=1 Tax=Kibdelosporangium banguiense TaxID=1365924 RepID=A0ABS4TVH5_9PSEU|nr:MOSC domain-containing protein [Kibdelosporangium banguiense]MBP2328392.1 ferredoxin-NADP reductase/uncharacterized protein YcbX [Kibdelosporangium banguiense]
MGSVDAADDRSDLETLPWLAGIGRYPVKGLGGESLAEVAVGLDGLPFDRALGLANGAVPLASFGTWTIFEAFDALDMKPDLGRCSARLSASGEVVVTGPDGDELRVRLDADGRLTADERHIADWLGSAGIEGRLISSGAHLWDFPDMPISIINLATVRELERVAGVQIDPRRFRANLYVDGLPPWAEFGLAGVHLRIGEVELVVVRPIERCRATAVEPGTGRVELDVPRLLTGQFGHLHCGMYAQVRTSGRLRVGDQVHCGSPVVLSRAQEGLTRREIVAAPRVATVTVVHRPANAVASLELEDPSGAFAQARPGQYLRVHRTGHDAPAWRNYTISRTGDDMTRITTQYHEGGVVSPWLSSLDKGDEVLVTGPCGDAFIDVCEGDPLLVLTAGIGITPALAVASALVTAGSERPVDFVHVAPDIDHMPHRDELEAAVGKLGNARLHLCVTRHGAAPPGCRNGRPDKEFIADIVVDPARTSVHLCGPAAFVHDMRAIAETLGVPANSIHWDPFYSPRPVSIEPRRAPHPGPFTVTYLSSGTTTQWTTEQGTLLDLAESRGLTMPSACRSGVCGSCAATVHGATAYLVDPMTETRSGQVLLCSSVPTTDVLVET